MQTIRQIFPAFEMEVPILVKEIGSFEAIYDINGMHPLFIEALKSELEERGIPADNDLVVIFDTEYAETDSSNIAHAVAYFSVEIYSLDKAKAKKARVMNLKYEDHGEPSN